MSRVVAAVVVSAVVSLGASLAQTPPPPTIAIVLDDASPATRTTAIAGINGLSGRVIHSFGDVLIVSLPAGNELRAYRLRGVREVILNAVPVSSRQTAASSFGIAAWNAIAQVPVDADRMGGLSGSMENDALVPPAISIEAVRAAARSGSRRGALSEAATATGGAPYGASDLNTSEFLAGSVSVNVILVESDGSLEMSSENWTATREAEVVGKIASGLEWVRLQEPQAALRFVYHVYAGRTDPRARTGYEPIRRSADPSGATGEDLWVKDVLAKFGYVSGDRFARSRAFDAETRRGDGTDWAVTVYVVDSLVDADGKFADGRFAYTWIGGPHAVMTYDNQSWGISRMDMVLRHEFLHAFYTFDEYTGSACTCTEHRGYLDGVNANCVTCNPVAGACVMIANGDAVCSATRRQLGWADLDGDGMIDVIGEDPDTFLDPSPSAVCTTPILTGLASVVAATNRNSLMSTPRASISINKIAGVEVRADGAAWSDAAALGGSWGAPQAHFGASFPALAPGGHLLEARAIDDHGNRDPNPGMASVIVYPSSAPLGDSVRGSKGPLGVVMTWTPCLGATGYRVYRRASPGGPESVAAETSQTSWSDAAGATGYYQVRPVDACGGERAD